MNDDKGIPVKQAKPAPRTKPYADIKIPFSLSDAQLICIAIVSGILACVFLALAVHFSKKEIGKIDRPTATHVSSVLPDTAGREKSVDSVVSREERLKADSGRTAFAEKLNAIVTGGVACGNSMLNANLQDPDAEIEGLRDRAAGAKKRIETVKRDFEKLSTSDTLFNEPLTLIGDGLKLLTEAVRSYNRYYFAEDEQEEAQWGRVMRKKAADANELLRKAGAVVRPR